MVDIDHDDEAIEDEFTFETLDFDEKSAESNEGGEGGIEVEDDENQYIPYIIKEDPDLVKEEEAMDYYLMSEKINASDLTKNKRKVKKDRIVRHYSVEDENRVNGLLQIEESGEFSCLSPGCNKRWKSKSGMKVHIRTVHLNMISFSCEQCKYMTRYRHALKAHILAVHENIEHKCDYCDYKAKYYTNIQSHVKFAHKNAEKLQCHLCEYQAKKQYLLDYHISGMHDKAMLHCDQCSFSTNWRNSLKKHEDYKHNKKKSYQCESCVFSFALPFELRRHMYLQHEAGKTLCFEKNDAGVFECDQCEYSSPSLRSIKIHFYNQHVE